jgi:hypothetical protein
MSATAKQFYDYFLSENFSKYLQKVLLTASYFFRRTLKFDTYLSTHIKRSKTLRELQTQISLYYGAFPHIPNRKKVSSKG